MLSSLYLSTKFLQCNKCNDLLPLLLSFGCLILEMISYVCFLEILKEKLGLSLWRHYHWTKRNMMMLLKCWNIMKKNNRWSIQTSRNWPKWQLLLPYRYVVHNTKKFITPNDDLNYTYVYINSFNLMSNKCAKKTWKIIQLIKKQYDSLWDISQKIVREFESPLVCPFRPLFALYILHETSEMFIEVNHNT